jgi:hypothetical protein
VRRLKPTVLGAVYCVETSSGSVPETIVSGARDGPFQVGRRLFACSFGINYCFWADKLLLVIVSRLSIPLLLIPRISETFLGAPLFLE